MAFSSTDAAFEGFRIARERPVAVLVWAAVYLVVSVIAMAIAAGLVGGDAVQKLNAAMAGDPAPEEVMAVLPTFMTFYGVMAPFALVLQSTLGAAIYRTVLRPEENASFFLRLGADEVRLLLVNVILSVMIGLGAGVVFAVAGALAGALAVVGGFLGGFVGFLVIVAALGAVVFAAVRLSLAGPITFGERQIAVVRSWGLTKGRFWPLLGAYVLAAAMAVVVALLGMVVFTGLAAVLGGGLQAAGEAQAFDPSDLGSILSSPLTLAFVVFSALMSTLQMVILGGVFAHAYAQLRGPAAA